MKKMFFLYALICLAGCSGTDNSPPRFAEIGKAAPEIKIKGYAGNMKRWEIPAEGTKIFVFFASWPRNAAEIFEKSASVSDFLPPGKKPEFFFFSDESPAELNRFLREEKLAGFNVASVSENALINYRVYGRPKIYLLRNGRISSILRPEDLNPENIDTVLAAGSGGG